MGQRSSEHLAKENQTLQALRDALSLREAIFESFPAVINAELRMFRADAEHRLELLMTGKVNRYNDVFERVASVAMRAKLVRIPLHYGCRRAAE